MRKTIAVGAGLACVAGALFTGGAVAQDRDAMPNRTNQGLGTTNDVNNVGQAQIDVELNPSTPRSTATSSGAYGQTRISPPAAGGTVSVGATMDATGASAGGGVPSEAT